MLIVKITPRLWLAFPDNRPRQYVFCEELRGKTLVQGEPIVEAIVEDRYQQWRTDHAL